MAKIERGWESVAKGQDQASERLTKLIPPAQWSVYATFITEASRRKIPFAVGGGLAVSAYAAYVRNTKDMDLFILAKDSGRAIELTRELGFAEYTEVPYDRTWSYRCSRDGYIIDFLWKMLNGKAYVDHSWLTLGWDLRVRGVPVKLLPVEDLIFAKLYILRMDRADWPDILSLLYARGAELDWERLIASLGDDRLLMGSVVNLFQWLCPGRACRFPKAVWGALGLLPPASCEPEFDRQRATLLHAENLFGDSP